MLWIKLANDSQPPTLIRRADVRDSRACHRVWLVVVACNRACEGRQGKQGVFRQAQIMQAGWDASQHRHWLSTSCPACNPSPPPHAAAPGRRLSTSQTSSSRPPVYVGMLGGNSSGGRPSCAWYASFIMAPTCRAFAQTDQ